MLKLLSYWWFRILIFIIILISISLISSLFFKGMVSSSLILVIVASIVSILIQTLRAGSRYNAFGLQFDKFTLPDILKGFVIVIGTNALFIVLGLMFGYEYKLSDNFDNYDIYTFYFYFGYLFLMAFSEEIMFRGIIFQSLRERFGNVTSIVIMSIFFSLAHIFNPNVSTMGLINVVLAGIMLSVMYITTESLWLPISFHFFWNLNQQVVLGSNISGIDFKLKIMELTAVGGNSQWLFGSNFGIEEGLLTTIILTFITIISFKINKQNPYIMATKFNIRNEESKLLG